MQIGILLFSGYIKTIQWLQDHMLSCPSKKYLHIECPGCGFQRSMIFLLKGEFINSFQMYPASLPIIFLFIFTAFHLKYKFPNGAEVIKYSQIIVGSIILIFYIYKIINHKITG